MADMPNPKNDTSVDSPSENQTPDNAGENQVETSPTQPLSEEETTWNNLSGKSQERFSEAIKLRKDAEEKARLLQAQLDYLSTQQVTTPTSKPNTGNDAEIRQAISKLREHGIPTFEDVKSYVDQSYANIWENNEHNRLTSKYASLKDYPAYDRDQVADYARSHGFGGNFEAAYREMYFDELADLRGRQISVPKPPTTTRPSASTTNRDEPMTVDTVREKLTGPQGRKWYEEQMKKNPEEFQALISQLSQG